MSRTLALMITGISGFGVITTIVRKFLLRPNVPGRLSGWVEGGAVA